ncbi:MAG: hypothetical protein WC851_02805 [Candidatus Shapirobacteria bacterium]|jgi:hypothetical protein
MDYPKHLGEKIRTKVATSYLKHELRKLFPSISEPEIEGLIVNKNLAIPRDFWNGVHGVGMGFKLHIGFIYLNTAENISWSFETIDIKSINFGVDRDLTRMAGSRSVEKIVEYLRANPKTYDKYLEEFKMNWVEDKQRETDPIIICEKKDGLAIYEGNGRLEKLILDNREKTKGYVGRYTTSEKRPLNYWLPTSLIMDLLLFVYQAIEEDDQDLFESQIKVIRNMLRDSESGKKEFIERALSSKKEYREPILTALGI